MSDGAAQSRAQAGVRQEIVALTEIPNVAGSSARLLFNSGLRTVEAVARAKSHNVIADILSAGKLLWEPRRVTSCCALFRTLTKAAAHAGSKKGGQKERHQLTMRALKIWRSARDLLKQRRLVCALDFLSKVPAC